MEDEAPRMVVAWLKDDQSAEDHERQPDRAHERRSVAPASGGQAPGSQRTFSGIPPAWLDPVDSPRLGCGVGKGECR